MENNQCPFAIYHYECDNQDCRKCNIMIENRAKANEDQKIADNMHRRPSGSHKGLRQEMPK